MDFLHESLDNSRSVRCITLRHRPASGLRRNTWSEGSSQDQGAGSPVAVEFLEHGGTQLLKAQSVGLDE
jgi:hypothetical protein